MPKKLFLMFVWPFLFRRIADKVASLLQARRDRRLYGDAPLVEPDCPPCPPVKTSSLNSTQAAIFTVAGVLLGGVLSAVTYFVARRSTPQPN